MWREGPENITRPTVCNESIDITNRDRQTEKGTWYIQEVEWVTVGNIKMKILTRFPADCLLSHYPTNHTF